MHPFNGQKGIGDFLLIDDAKVSALDVSNNFFIRGDADVGKYRADVVTDYLLELNPDVKGATLHKVCFLFRYGVLKSFRKKKRIVLGRVGQNG